MEIYYDANGYNYKLVEEEDTWWSIYRWHRYRMKYVPIIQAKTLEKAYTYCNMCEAVTVPLQELC